MSVFPTSRRRRIATIAALSLVAAIALWIWVFPWVDRTYVNRPAVEGEIELVTPSP